MLAAVLVCTILVAAAGGVFPDSGTAAHRSAGTQAPSFGFNDKASYEAARPRLLRLSRLAGANVGRLPVHVDHIDLHRLDRSYRRMHRYGLVPLLALYGMDGNERRAEWKRLVRQLAARYPYAHFQIGNEPNIERFGAVPAGQMARLIGLAERVIHRLNPVATVLVGGPAPVPPRGEHLAYMRRLARGTRGRRVALGAHIYPRDWGLRESIGPAVVRAMRDFRAVRRMAGRRAVWVTETGFSRADYGERAASLSARLYRRLSRAGAQGIIFHTLRPHGGRIGHQAEARLVNEWEAGLGALDLLGRRTDTYRALRHARLRDLRFR